MNDTTKIGASHLSRAAYVYLRQSSPAQVEHNRESTQRQYALVSKAAALGWPAQQVIVIDEDLGLSGAGVVERSGFARLTAEVALGHVGIVLGLEVSRLARNNADWYRLLDLCGLTDTLIGDADGIYHPAMFNDRLLLGLKGTMSEAELHVLRARLNGGIRNKAARGELRRGLPVGFIWGEEDGEVLFHPDEAVCTAIRTVFARFSELGSVRRVWLWLRSEGLSFPLQTRYGGGIRWVDPSYIAVYHVLTNPVYAGAYAYGKSRHEVTLDQCGARKKRVRKLPQSQWSVLIQNHHQGFIDWSTYETNRIRISANTHPRPHQSGSGAVREGTALCCKVSPSADTADASCAPNTPAAPPLRAITAPVRQSRMDAASTASTSAPCRSTTRWRRLCSPHSRHWASKLHSPPPSGSRPITTVRWHSGVLRWSGRATRRSAPSAVIVLSIRTTAWSPVASKPNGRSRFANWRLQKRNWYGANTGAPGRSALKSVVAYSL